LVVVQPLETVVANIHLRAFLALVQAPIRHPGMLVEVADGLGPPALEALLFGCLFHDSPPQWPPPASADGGEIKRDGISVDRLVPALAALGRGLRGGRRVVLHVVLHAVLRWVL